MMETKSIIKEILYFSIVILAIILINIASAQDNPFNLEVQIAESYKEVNPGGEIWFTTKILNLDEVHRKDITLEYRTISFEEKVITSKTETVAIETQASFVGNLQIPKNTLPGNYELEVKIIINDQEEAKGKDSFTIIMNNEKRESKIMIILILTVLLSILVFLFYFSRRILKRTAIKKRIKEIIKKREIDNKIT